jgi:hypothetical protein
MFRRRLRAARLRIALAKIKRFVRGYALTWIAKKKQEKQQILYDFLKYKADSAGKVEMRCLKYYKISTLLISANKGITNLVVFNLYL